MQAIAPRLVREAPVRYRDGDFEFRCAMCDQWWPLTTDFWRPANGMQRCKACWREYHRIREAARTADEATRLVKNYKNRLRYAENREARRESNRRWREANREHRAAYNKAYRERNKARIQEQSAAYYAEAREVILLKKRRARAEAAA